jgi:hypothetical protein
VACRWPASRCAQAVGGTATLVAIIARIACNRYWWDFEVAGVAGYMRKYQPRESHMKHADLNGTQPLAQVSVSVQLSGSGDYEGGALLADRRASGRMQHRRLALVGGPRSGAGHGRVSVVRWCWCSAGIRPFR